MEVPLLARSLAAAVGGLFVLATACQRGRNPDRSPTRCRLAHQLGPPPRCRGMFRLVTSGIADYRHRDRLLAGEAASTLIAATGRLVGGVFRRVRTLVLALRVRRHNQPRSTLAGSSLFTLGFAAPPEGAPKVIIYLAAATGLIIISLQIAYLPTLYSAFNRRETEVALLNARAGVPSWGPELLARTHYALGSGVSTLDTLPDLYARWERWAADVAESHSTYLPLVRFRSPRPLSSWVTALLAMLDSAALFLALSPQSAPVVPARLFLRAGFLCFNQIANAVGIHVPEEPDPNSQISLTYQEFLEAIQRMRAVDFPIERDPAEAWPDFVGWRLNYETRVKPCPRLHSLPHPARTTQLLRSWVDANRGLQEDQQMATDVIMGSDGKPRCSWAGAGDGALSRYHDQVWGVRTHDETVMFEALTLGVFQVGLSWSIVFGKRDAFREAFHGFDIAKVAAMTDRDVDRLLQDPSIIRNRGKIQATITNARAMRSASPSLSRWPGPTRLPGSRRPGLWPRSPSRRHRRTRSPSS